MKNKKILWITETAVMLALLITLQWAGSMIPEQMTKQLITGTFVNAVLAVTVLMVGRSSGATVAVISPVCAFLLHIAPNIITVIPIMMGNLCFVLLLHWIVYLPVRGNWKKPAALALASTVKFGVLYLLVVKLICGPASGLFLGKKLGETVLLAPKMLLPKALPTMFAWPQLVTALAGGALALCITPAIKKALHK